MWLLIFCVVVIASGAFAEKDVILESMCGLEGRNKIAICVRTASGWRHCDGALYNREWALARALCLGTAHVANLTVERLAHGGSCQTLAASGGNLNHSTSRRVHELMLHPWADLALIIVKTPYYKVDEHANITKINNRLRPHGVFKWMKSHMKNPCLSRNPYIHTRLQKPSIVLLHPLWYFSVTMLLPTVLYLLFFVYITFYTGTSCKTDKTSSYTELQYSKKVTHI